MARLVRPCLKALSSNDLKKMGTHSALLLLLASVLAACIAIATAAANCTISSYPETGSLGQENPAEEDMRRCFVADPVNCATGNLTEAHVDLSVQGHGPPLQLVRYYNSKLAANQTAPGSFGYGWTSTYSSKLTFDASKKVALVTHDNGSTMNFELEGGQWRGPVWTQATLVQSGENYIYSLPDHTQYEFASSGRLLKITDRHNLTLTLTYNGSGRLESVADQSFVVRKLTFSYNASGQVEKVTDPMGRVAKYSYSSGNLANVTLPGMETPRWKFGYNGFHELTALTNGRGYTTTTTYDSSHRATSQTDPLNRKYSFVYKETAGVDETTITEPNGSTTLEKFNEAGSPTSIAHAVGTSLEAVNTYTYNTGFRLLSATDPLKHTTTYTYDARGNRLTAKDPNGNETKWTYNSANDVTSMTNPKGLVTNFNRNSAGDPLEVYRTIGSSTQVAKFEYNSAGDLIKKVDPVGRERKYLPSPVGGVPMVEYQGTFENQNMLRSWVYNLNGEVIEEVDGRGYEAGNEKAQFTTKYTRDSQGRPTVVRDPLGATSTMAYDANGNLAVSTDSLGHEVSYTYDAADQRIETKNGNGAVVKEAYDSMGQRLSRTNGVGNTTEYKHDALGRMTETIDPLGRKTVNAYDLAGNLTKVTDAEARTTTFTYDPGDRNTKIDYSDPATADVSLVYDKDGNVSEMTDGTGTTKRTYDALDRLIEVVNGKGEVAKYEYNLASDVTKLTYPNGKAVTQGFDSLGRLEKVVDWFSKETKFAYYRNGQLKTTTFPVETGNVDEYAYNARGDVTQISMKKGLEVFASFAYTRDKAGQVEKVIQKGFPGRPEEVTYGYDPGNRLLKGGGTSFGYDLANDPTTLGAESFTYDKANQIATASSGTMVFNKLGERTKSTPTGGPATTYAYDQAGNLTSAQRPAEGEVEKIDNTFKYDGTGLRTTETNGASTYPMMWDTTSDVPRLLHKGNDYYIYGPEGLPISQIISSSTHYFHHDQLGSTRVLTSTAGAVIGTYEYSPYGLLTFFSGTQSTQMGYAGQYRSHTSRLIYLRARTYDPATAQFLSVDPAVLQTGEPYSYAEDNPVNKADPTGLTTEGLCIGGSAAVSFIGASGSICVVSTSTGETAITATVPAGFAGVISWDGKKTSSLMQFLESAKDSRGGGSIDFEWVRGEANTLSEFVGLADFVDFSGGWFGLHGGYERAVSRGSGLVTKTYKFGIGTPGIGIGGGTSNTIILRNLSPPPKEAPPGGGLAEDGRLTIGGVNFHEVECDPYEI